MTEYLFTANDVLAGMLIGFIVALLLVALIYSGIRTWHRSVSSATPEDFRKKGAL